MGLIQIVAYHSRNTQLYLVDRVLAQAVISWMKVLKDARFVQITASCVNRVIAINVFMDLGLIMIISACCLMDMPWMKQPTLHLYAVSDANTAHITLRNISGVQLALSALLDLLLDLS